MPKPLHASVKERRIFVSYAHADVAGARELMKWLRPICHRLPGTSPVWVDFEELRAGDDWNAKILHALESASIYIVLMSIDYVASKFCMEQELRRILLRRANNPAQVTVIGIAYRSCRLQDFIVPMPDHPDGNIGLAQVQCIPQATINEVLGLRSLDTWDATQRDSAWMTLASQLEDALLAPAQNPVKWNNANMAATRVAYSTSQPERADDLTSSSARLRAEWLPYLANRRDQCVALIPSVMAWRSTKFARPLVVLTEARSEDCPAKWTSRLHQYELAETLELGKWVPEFGHYKSLPWPTSAGQQRTDEAAAMAFVPAMAHALSCPPTVSPLELFESERRRNRPTFLWVAVNDSSEIATARRALSGLLHLLEKRPDSGEQGLLVLALNIIRSSQSPPSNRAILGPLFERLIARAQAKGSIHCAALGSLPELDETEIVAWSQEHAAAMLVDDVEILCLEQLPQTETRTWPMRTFAKFARNWIVPENFRNRSEPRQGK